MHQPPCTAAPRPRTQPLLHAIAHNRRSTPPRRRRSSYLLCISILVYTVADYSAHQSAEGSAHQSAEGSTDRSADCWADRSADCLADRAADRAADRQKSISGLEPVAVAAIPTLKFNSEAFSSMEDAQCSICLSEYEDKEVLRIMPKCGHIFHLSCIDVWLRKQSTCPVCRLSLQDSVERKHDEQSTTPQSLYHAEITAERSISVDLDTAVSREAIVRS